MPDVDSVPVLVKIAEDRANLERAGKKAPYVIYLQRRRAIMLRAEMALLKCYFGLPMDGYVPEPKYDDVEWIYWGLVLDDVHVWARGVLAR